MEKEVGTVTAIVCTRYKDNDTLVAMAARLSLRPAPVENAACAAERRRDFSSTATPGILDFRPVYLRLRNSRGRCTDRREIQRERVRWEVNRRGETRANFCPRGIRGS